MFYIYHNTVKFGKFLTAYILCVIKRKLFFIVYPWLIYQKCNIIWFYFISKNVLGICEIILLNSENIIWLEKGKMRYVAVNIFHPYIYI